MVTGGVEVPGGIQRVSGIPGVEDLVGLAKWMAGADIADLGDLRGVQLIAGGRSNLTYRLDFDGGQLVLRRPPLGHVLPTAHDMNREYRVLSALHGTAVPVPEPVANCLDVEVIGAPFYLMKYVDGLVLRTVDDGQLLTAAPSTALSDLLVLTLATIPAGDMTAATLA